MPLKSDKYFTILELALLHYKKGDYNDALGLIQEAKELNQIDGALSHVGALSAFRIGNLSLADSFIKEAIRFEPQYAPHWNVEGEILRLLGDPLSAIKSLQRALALDPAAADVYSNLGNVYSDAQDFENAAAAYQKALVVAPGHVDALYNLGNIAFKCQKFSVALDSYQKALAIAPEHLGALNNYGILLTTLGEVEEAISVYKKLLALKPDFLDGIGSYAKLLRLTNRPEEAEQLLENSLSIIPSDQALRIHLLLGEIRRDLGRRVDALKAFKAAFALDPLHQDAINGIINMDIELGNFVSATRRIESECERHPKDLSMSYARCFLTLPPIYRDEDEIHSVRKSYERLLGELSETLAIVPEHELDSLVDILGSSQPFYLPYQGMNDRELQARYGSMLCSTLARVVTGSPNLSSAPINDRKIRIGFVSGFFRGHSNYKIPVRGWIKHLDRSRFEIYGYHTQGRVDAYTKEAEGLCSHFNQGPKSLSEWIDILQRDQLDVIIYPEIGMDPMCCKLACLRLAPHQAVSWGHPNTSGIPTIDYFLSSELMEPDNGQEFYTEQLVRLPNLSFSYEPPERSLPPLTREGVGIRPDAFAYWCCQTNYKYLPRNDWIFPEIAARVPNAQFVFIQIQSESEAASIFRERLAKAFADKGLDATNFVTYLPALEAEQFSAIAGLCDIALDSFEWSGCNSTLETLAQGTPVLTCPGMFMRSRHSAAVLTLLECPETIVASPAEFVDRAVEYSQNKKKLAQLRKRVKSLISRAYNDTTSVKGLQDTLIAWFS